MTFQICSRENAVQHTLQKILFAYPSLSSRISQIPIEHPLLNKNGLILGVGYSGVRLYSSTRVPPCAFMQARSISQTSRVTTRRACCLSLPFWSYISDWLQRSKCEKTGRDEGMPAVQNWRKTSAYYYSSGIPKKQIA